MGLGRNFDFCIAVERRDLDFPAERSGGEADRHLAVQIVVIALEHRVRLEMDYDIEIA